MKLLPFALMVLGSISSASAGDVGLINVASKYSVPETIERLQSVVKSHGLTVFALINFGGDAEKVGLAMQPAQLLIFGNPKAGTPLMIASPSIAIDLPLKALAWENSNGKVWLSYNKPEYLQQRHRLPDDLVKNISGIKELVEKAVE
jgi:uncharacterized protein (DUF302 family)